MRKKKNIAQFIIWIIEKARIPGNYSPSEELDKKHGSLSD